jgi:hypothetical protein
MYTDEALSDHHANETLEFRPWNNEVMYCNLVYGDKNELPVIHAIENR